MRRPLAAGAAGAAALLLLFLMAAGAAAEGEIPPTIPDDLIKGVDDQRTANMELFDQQLGRRGDTKAKVAEVKEADAKLLGLDNKAIPPNLVVTQATQSERRQSVGRFCRAALLPAIVIVSRPTPRLSC
jgi:hypothetical protein